MAKPVDEILTRCEVCLSDHYRLPLMSSSSDIVLSLQSSVRFGSPIDIEAFKKRCLAGMDTSLVRNLSDRRGNNLLHVMAVYGHLPPLRFLLASHRPLLDALHDENQAGLTPLVCAVKYGHLRLLQWLVEENDGVREKLRARDGERSLLHVAAKYGQEEIVAWLARCLALSSRAEEEEEEEAEGGAAGAEDLDGFEGVEGVMGVGVGVMGRDLDGKDHLGNTALHLAARAGSARVCALLLQHGADATLK
ncbi:synphilin-1-like, partial [Penaeus japonicus]|uniref:synphilin-1-like n=1 Tax=Penaeus japonicus TaxID=27405 RepID=UPI001C7153ED